MALDRTYYGGADQDILKRQYEEQINRGSSSTATGLVGVGAATADAQKLARQTAASTAASQAAYDNTRARALMFASRGADMNGTALTQLRTGSDAATRNQFNSLADRATVNAVNAAAGAGGGALGVRDALATSAAANADAALTATSADRAAMNQAVQMTLANNAANTSTAQQISAQDAAVLAASRGQQLQGTALTGQLSGQVAQIGQNGLAIGQGAQSNLYNQQNENDRVKAQADLENQQKMIQLAASGAGQLLGTAANIYTGGASGAVMGAAKAAR